MSTQIYQEQDIISFTPFVEDIKGKPHHIDLYIKGAKCAACIQKIESSLKSDPLVEYARLNFSTGKLSITWRDDIKKIDEFVKQIRDLGYGVSYLRDMKDDNETEQKLLHSLSVSAFAMGNVMLISFALWFYGVEQMGIGMRDFLHLIIALIALPTILYSGQVFFRSAYSVLKKGHTNMDVPISLGVILACLISLIGLFTHEEHLYFDSAIMLIFFLLLGRYFDARVRQKAKSAASDLLSMMVQVATIETENGGREHIDVRRLTTGMIIFIAAGERIPADSEIIDGSSEIDMSLVTGETIPVTVNTGETLFAGTLNIQSPLKARVLKPSTESLLSDIVRLVEKAESVQGLYVRIADRAAQLYTPCVHILAAVTFGGWMMAGLPFMDCLMRATTVLIITCPCALGLAVPVVQVLAVSRLMKAGILVKDGAALEKLSKIDTIVFDKTGTLTEGKPILFNRQSIEDDDLQYAASMAVHSKHPLSKAVVAAWEGALLDIQAHEIAGSGMESLNTGYRLGRKEWCAPDFEISEPDKHLLRLYFNDPFKKKIVEFQFKDNLKEDAHEVVRVLKSEGLKVHILSGDRTETVQTCAEQLSIESYHANKRPDEKVDFLNELKAKNHNVLMVGDGLNDTPVLAAAHSAMSPASAIDMAQNTASIIFSGSLLSPITKAWHIAKDSQLKIKQNFSLAIIYNVFAVPLAVMGFVTPLVAAIAMSSSSMIVVGNSLRLKNVKI